MSNENEKKGFSGLSSLLSNVEEIEGESTHRNVHGERLATGEQSKDEQQPNPEESATRPRPIPEAQSEQEIVVSGTSRIPASNSSWANWFWGVIGLGVLIWLFNAPQEDDHKVSTAPSYLQSRPSTNSLPSRTSRSQLSGLEFSKPPVGDNNILSMMQLRWCLREGIRIEALRTILLTNIQVDQFNAVVADYNSRCGSFRYHRGTLERARREVEKIRAATVSQTLQNSASILAGIGTRDGNSVKEAKAPVPNTAGNARPKIQRSEAVLEAQKLLKELGYDPGVPDGLYGARTKAAIEEFQRDHEQIVNGTVTKSLLTSLRKATHKTISPKPVTRSEPTPSSRLTINQTEMAAIENTCGWRRNSQGPAAYYKCLEQQIRSLQ